jgi:NAD(P)H-hydrate repair Nnr-like enzyme with NAD(P)H-hydrate dehydratase domain
MTPHSGEMAALLECHKDAVTADPAGVAADVARRFGAVVVLKDAETVIAAPNGKLLHYAGGGVGLGTGGSGDVLAGAIGGLLARGLPPLVAAGWGVWLHGEAGRALATRIGPVGFLARELLPELPRLLPR